MARCTCCEQASQSETQIWNPHVDVQVAKNTTSHRITWSGAGQLTFNKQSNWACCSFALLDSAAAYKYKLGT